ncbi:MAG TPA: S26 family signal peptidase [Mesorhizobium sp.]|jgi:conjugative transfer signal peptidase TraF|nr:S26 family signal peptidase [Mesorhizobium sp.]
MNKIMLATLGASALLAFTAISPRELKLVWNASASVPVGLYAISPAGKLAVADLVLVMPPEPLASLLAGRGYLLRGVPLLKRVAALPGQTVCRKGHNITVDGVTWGMARERDHRGRELPVWRGCRRIREGEIFLLNRDTPGSLDGRYFGPLPVTSIAGHAWPVWTDEGT